MRFGITDDQMRSLRPGDILANQAYTAGVNKFIAVARAQMYPGCMMVDTKHFSEGWTLSMAQGLIHIIRQHPDRIRLPEGV